MKEIQVDESPAAVAEHLPANILADGGGAIQLEQVLGNKTNKSDRNRQIPTHLQQHVGLQQVLGAVNIEIRDRGGETHPLVLQE